MPVWAVTERTIPFSSILTENGVTIGIGQTINAVAPLKIIQAVRKDTSTDTDTMMDIYTYDRYQDITNKTSEGTPLAMFYQPLGPANSSSGVIKIWLLPDDYWQTNGQLYIRYQRPFQDMTATTDEPDFPIHWVKALTYQTAYLLAPSYGLDMTQRGMLKADMKEAVEEALSFGTEEGSFFLQPRLSR
jgi:hypothetical protein